MATSAIQTMPDISGRRFDIFTAPVKPGRVAAAFYQDGRRVETFGRTSGRAMRRARRLHAELSAP